MEGFLKGSFWGIPPVTSGTVERNLGSPPSTKWMEADDALDDGGIRPDQIEALTMAAVDWVLDPAISNVSRDSADNELIRPLNFLYDIDNKHDVTFDPAVTTLFIIGLVIRVEFRFESLCCFFPLLLFFFFLRRCFLFLFGSFPSFFCLAPFAVHSLPIPGQSPPFFFFSFLSIFLPISR